MKRLIPALVLVVFLAACSASSVLNAIADWTPFAVSTFQGFVAIVAPANSTLPAEATAIAKLVSDVGTAAAAAQSAGSGVTGMQKVIAEIQAVIPQINNFETDMGAAGLNMSANDQKYVSATAAFVLATLEGYEAELQAKAGQTVSTTAMYDQMHTLAMNDDCFKLTGGPDNWDFTADCSGDPADAITMQGTKTSVSVKKPPTIANFKRQFNALARKYGHPERQLKLSTRDHFVHVLTLGTR